MSSYFYLTLDNSLNDRVFRFLPNIYDENETAYEIVKAQNIEINRLENNGVQAFRNNFAVTANEEGIARYEKMLGIVPDVLLESLEFRRNRVINKMSLRMPFTRLFLINYLNSIYGENNYILEINPSEYYVFFRVIMPFTYEYLEQFTYDELSRYTYGEMSLSDDDYNHINILYAQTIKDIREFIPANMILIVPFMYLYLEKTYTYQALEQFTYEELSR